MTDTADLNTLAEDGGNRFFKKLGRQTVGFLILAASIVVCLSLASWNIEDPSFTHATGKTATNWLGFFGAAISDILFQFFGIVAIAFALLPSFWGASMIRQRLAYLSIKQFGFFISFIALSCAFVTCLPTPDSWPIPTGLGGLIGVLLYAIPASILGDNPSGWMIFIIGILFLAPLPFLAKGALRLPKAIETPMEPDVKHQAKIADDLADEEENEGVILPMLLGVLGHIWYSNTAKIKIFFTKRAEKIRREHVPQHDLTMMEGAPSGSGRFSTAFDKISHFKRKFIDEAAEDDGLGDYIARLEPNAVGETDAPVQIEDSPVEEISTPPLQPVGIATPAPKADENTISNTVKVSKQASPAQPGKRIVKEAQQSFSIMKTATEFDLPPLRLLSEAPADHGKNALSPEALTHNAALLEGVLDDFGVKGEIVHVRPGPVVTLYELEPAPGIKSSRVIGLADDIARSMSAIAARVAVIPGKNAIGIELPNANRETVYLHESIASKTFETHKGKLPICLGKTIGGESVIADLARMPHLLVAGTTGSGKSVAINTMILSLLFRMTPEQCKLIMIDPKMLELSVYDGIPHLLTPVVTDPKKAVVALKWTVREMEDRYRKMSKVGVRNIDGFNTRVKQAAEKNEPIIRTIQTGYDQESGEAIYEREELDLAPLPFIVVIIDEMADLMMVAGKDIEGAIQRLAQMARAAGIHVIMATQRPSVDVITGTIKANFPTRISFQVTSKIDSRTILGEQGAEQLLGMGDMLYMAGGGRIQRVHGPFVSDDEVEDIVRHLKDQGVPQYLEAVTEETDDEEATDDSKGGNVSENADPYDQAVAIVLRDKKASTSYIQRRLGIGYNRAATIIERMEEEGVVGPANHAGKREILVGSDPEDDFNFTE